MAEILALKAIFVAILEVLKRVVAEYFMLNPLLTAILEMFGAVRGYIVLKAVVTSFRGMFRCVAEYFMLSPPITAIR